MDTREEYDGDIRSKPPIRTSRRRYTVAFLGGIGILCLITVASIFLRQDSSEKGISSNQGSYTTPSSQEADAPSRQVTSAPSVSSSSSSIPVEETSMPTRPPTLAPSIPPTNHPTNLPSVQPTSGPTEPFVFVGSSDVSTGVVDGVAYNHCPGTEKHLVLLHGASFNKDTWNTNGLMEGFCAYDTLSVTALDLSVSSGHTRLKTLLTAMKDEHLVTLPVALVSPSASGRTMADWIMNGDVSDIPQFVNKWIPVACPSVASASNSQLESIVGLVDILAIYGDQDTAGGKISERLKVSSNATVLELQGGHPVYLHSPDEFVQNVLEFIGTLA
eukprot:Nitzschia sp. Nitz4//scaffold100_size80364//28086//29075//NITZ4_005341-RA/size80364-processed-gene-0.32-mRNA-1//1//CDS//3329532085//1965//frame0